MIRLFYNYYEDKVPQRKREIDFCLQRNLENKFINTIIMESDSKPTYTHFFDKINTITGPDDINIICNSDIFLDESIQLTSHLKHKEMYALARWEWQTDNLVKFSNRPDSQDTWIIRGKIENVFGDFSLGRPGCDNRIAYEFSKSGYKVMNPGQSIKTYHVHNSQVRTYKPADTVPGPYLTLPPESLINV